METVLIISSSDKGREFFEGLLRSAGFSRIVTAVSGSEARRRMISAEFDLIVINAPLAGEFGSELAIRLAVDTMAGILLAVKGDIAEEAERGVEDYGVFVIPKPLNRQTAHQALKMAAASQRRMAGLREENARLRAKLEELRLVDRAKCVLIERQHMTERQAHRSIEKQAMDTRSTKREVAWGILEAYGE